MNKIGIRRLFVVCKAHKNARLNLEGATEMKMGTFISRKVKH